MRVAGHPYWNNAHEMNFLAKEKTKAVLPVFVVLYQEYGAVVSYRGTPERLAGLNIFATCVTTTISNTIREIEQHRETIPGFY